MKRKKESSSLSKVKLMTELLPNMILSSTKDTTLIAVLKEANFLVDKSKELLLQEQSLENQESCSWMKPHQHLMRSHRKKSKLLLIIS
jgi:hypothetical protein